ncbi:hypothetical protein PFICI_12516 [Pestalotiopsis fici W106-1]|uniref:2EXR domain-containing protein n=1 Tax=Pestalotiopsis fici (strain W106-1 / CGMCC3.15140) TaxID=1229662 RepID=W3WQX5_PESFW|nr:uncharacterized protein PFICI_12516 [Pestalotiopsis fici W106-1]ETS75572.1 hypothetical protein PFICI_12516 [Pestalotiopsis fici W106-1]
MSEATTDPSSFPQFGKLPPELRMLVWKHSLPSIEPALYPYITGLWEHRKIDDGDARFNRSDPTANVEMYFRHELLRSGARLEIPAILVNRESHAVARAWLRDPPYRVWRHNDRAPEAACDDPQHWSFQRLFDPASDIIYVAPERWLDFLSEQDSRTLDDDMIDFNPQPFGYNYRTAVDFNVLWNAEEDFSDVVGGYFHDIQNLHVIVRGAPKSVNDALSGRWRLQPAPGGHLYYDIDLERIRFKSDGYLGDTAMFKRLRKILQPLVYQLAPRFECLREWLREKSVGDIRTGDKHSIYDCAKTYVFLPVYAMKR